MTSVAERKRRKRQKWAEANGMAVAPVGGREADGRPKRSQSPEYERDAAVGPLQARCRLAGLQQVRDNIRSVAAQSFEGQAGMAINAGAKDKDEVQKLWAVFTALDGAEAMYYRHYVGLNRHPKTAKIEMEPQVLETRPDDRPDLRDAEQKARDAVNGWMRWRGYLGHLAASDQTAIHDALKHRRELSDCGVLTKAGRAFIGALRKLVVFVER